MLREMNMVCEFHEKLDISHQTRLPTEPLDKLEFIGKLILRYSQDLEQYMRREPNDPRWLRAHLCVEEAAELCLAMAAGDEVATLDALADLSVVTIGSAVMLDLPLDLAFDEVHRSNMTKEKQPTDVSAARVRDKGPNYKPADVAGVLVRYREHSAPHRPTVVCLCGSTRFYDAFQEANYRETMAGKIVLSVGVYPHSTATHKVALDELHKRKIDIADEVLILDVGGYIGNSTRSELEYALAYGKRVRYLSAENFV